MKNRILVTGSAGYIGSRLVPFLERSCPDISVGTIDKTSDFDLADSAKTAGAIHEFEPDVLIHLATHSALAYRDRFLNSFRDDSQVLYNILEGLEPLPNCRFIYISTSYVYSGLGACHKVSEENPLKPSHPFGIAKTFFESFILKNHPESVIFRLFSVFGRGNYLFPNSVHAMIQECMEKRTVTVWGEGKRKMQYVFIQDVLECLLKSFSIDPGIYNVGGDEYLSTAEAAGTIAKIFGGDVVFLKDKKEGETLSFGDNAKIKKACGRDSFTSFAKAIREYQA